jgi:hypothetical protein
MNNLKKKKFPNVVRATFSLPHDAPAEIEKLRTKFGKNGCNLNKSEIVRIGLTVLGKLPQNDLKEAADTLNRMKAGRPRLIDL